MKKLALALALLALGRGRAAAQGAPIPAAAVRQQFAVVSTCTAVNISSSVASSVQGTTVTVSAVPNFWTAVSIQNQDATANLFCGPAYTVQARSGSSYNVNIGWEISPGTPGGSSTFTLVPGENWYCVNDTTTRTSIAVVCRGY